MPVIAAISRKGNVVAKAIENTKRSTLDGFIRKIALPDVELLVTDEHTAYSNLKAEYPHEIVRHRENE